VILVFVKHFVLFLELEFVLPQVVREFIVDENSSSSVLWSVSNILCYIRN